MTFEDLIASFPEAMDESKAEAMKRFFILLQETNAEMNLTRIDEEKEAVVKHFYDSLAVTRLLKVSGKVADIGSGAGFPGIVLAIAFPEAHFSLVESNGKKCRFLHQAVEALDLGNVSIINARAENLREKETFDIAIARAVSDLRVLAELIAPLLQVGGRFVAMKGRNADEELMLAKHALKETNLSLEQEDTFELPEEMGERKNLLFVKTKKNSRKYPRDYAEIKRNPL